MRKDPDGETADRQQRKRKEERRKISKKEGNEVYLFYQSIRKQKRTWLTLLFILRSCKRQKYNQFLIKNQTF